jgi:hypothetical protein
MPEVNRCQPLCRYSGSLALLLTKGSKHTISRTMGLKVRLSDQTVELAGAYWPEIEQVC